MQNYGTVPGQKKPHKFTPRKDLFPDENPILPNRQTPVHKPKQESIPNVSTAPSLLNLDFSPLTLVVVLIGWMLLAPRFKAGARGLDTIKLQSIVQEAVENPKYLDMLKDVAPYLEGDEQDLLYSVTGAMEIAGGIRELMNHSYHHRQQNMVMSIPTDHMAKRMDLLKAIRPYLPEMDRETLNSIVKAYETGDKLHKNFKIYQNNRILSEDRKISPLETIQEIAKVIRPIIPPAYLSQADKALTVLKMAEVMDLNSPYSQGSKGKSSNKVNENASSPMDQAENIANSLKPMLSEEQQETMDVIMKMAQLLAQPEEETDKI